MTSGSATGRVADGLDRADLGGTADPAGGMFEVVLDPGPGTVLPEVIKAIRGLTGLNLKEAAALAKSGGLVLRAGDADAAAVQRTLQAAGGTVTVVPVHGSDPRPAARPHARTRRLVLPPAGEQTRPNGQVYKPRELGGHEDIAVLRAARAATEHVLLYGPPGTGKTALAEAAFAGPDGSGLETIVCTADTTEADFAGTFVHDPASGSYPWIPGPLHGSVLADVPLFVDEIALADPRVLPVLYALMDGRAVLRITSNPALPPIPVGPGWFVIAACNPDAPGANMSDALRDRFTHHIQVESDWELAAELGVPPQLVTIARNLDRRRHDGQLTWSPQLRSLLDFTSLARRYGPAYAAASLAAKAPEADRAEITTALRTSYRSVTPLSLGPRYGT